MTHRLRREDFSDWASYYREYQGRLAREYLVPAIREWGLWSERPRILDVGCGDGGAALALAESGALVDGIEIESRRLQGAMAEAQRRGLELRLQWGDITDAASLAAFQGSYDLILLRDVLEHIPQRDAALRNARKRLAPSGGIVVVFPPYFSAFGGHQQLLHPRRILGMPFARLPWAHCLPRLIFAALARRADGSLDPQWEEIETIAASRLSLAAMRRAVAQQGLQVTRERHYLLRPSFRLRYGTPVLRAGWLGKIPVLREVVVTASYQLLQRPFGS